MVEPGEQAEKPLILDEPRLLQLRGHPLHVVVGDLLDRAVLLLELAFNSMLSNFNKKVYGNDELEELYEASAYPFEEIITIASLIEKETDGSDRSNISSVIPLARGGNPGSGLGRLGNRFVVLVQGATSPPRSAWQTMPPPGRGTTWGRSGSSWPGS